MTMISDTITVSTYRIWGGIRRLQQGEHVLQTRSLRLPLALGQASLARAKVAQSGRRTVARAHFLVTVGVNGHHESVNGLLPFLDQMRGAPPGRSEWGSATRCLLLLWAVPGLVSKASAVETGTLAVIQHRLRAISGRVLTAAVRTAVGPHNTRKSGPRWSARPAV